MNHLEFSISSLWHELPGELPPQHVNSWNTETAGALRKNRDFYYPKWHIHTYTPLCHGRPHFAKAWPSRRHGHRGLLGGRAYHGIRDLDHLWQTLGQVQLGPSLDCLQREETCVISCSELLAPSNLSGCLSLASWSSLLPWIKTSVPASSLLDLCSLLWPPRQCGSTFSHPCQAPWCSHCLPCSILLTQWKLHLHSECTGTPVPLASLWTQVPCLLLYSKLNLPQTANNKTTERGVSCGCDPTKS